MVIGYGSPVSDRKRKFSPGSPHIASAKRSKKPGLRIGGLPTDILSSITSKLPLKEAARTSILSSQWRRIWLCRPNIDLSYHTLLSQSDDARRWTTRRNILNRLKFIKSVGEVLQQHEGLGTESIRISFHLCDRYADHMDKWMKYTIASKAKGLILELLSVNFGPTIVRYNFPLQMLDTKKNSSLRRLRLHFVSLCPPADFRGFQNLTRLCLQDVSITNEDLQRLLSEGNHLECFRIACCETLTSLKIPHYVNRLKFLLVLSCPLLQDISLDCDVPALHYRGPLIPLKLAAPSKLTNLWIMLPSCHSALGFISSELPTTIRHLEKLRLCCSQFEGTDVVSRLRSFLSLRQLILDLTITDLPRRTIDILDLGYLLEAAPFMEKLELHMVMRCLHKRYRPEDGELRSLPSCPHSHLSLVTITGFIGEKDQLELALHILRNAMVLKALKIYPRPCAVDSVPARLRPEERIADGRSVALEFLAKSDHRNVVEVIAAFNLPW
uniref:Uncharacterized protein n=4 Tax=Avena sativa TaxID=4498 RepID=A0ACD5ZDU5_AVESA